MLKCQHLLAFKHEHDKFHVQLNWAWKMFYNLGTWSYYGVTVLYAVFVIFQGEKVSYSGDPLQDFTLIRFLDRFVYKNPKNKEQGKGCKSVFDFVWFDSLRPIHNLSVI